MWARQHLFERVFTDAKAEREHVAAIQEDFLKRSFNSLLAQADSAIIAAEEEIDRGIQGAEGRLRKAELVKEQHQQRSRLRLAGSATGPQRRARGRHRDRQRTASPPAASKRRRGTRDAR